MTEGHAIAALVTVVSTLAGIIAKMALHVRDLNKRLTQQAEKHAQATATLHTEWRGEIKTMNKAHSQLLLQTNRTLDAWLAARGKADDV